MHNKDILVVASQKGQGKIALDALKIRHEVFIEEQKISPEDELDRLDDKCIHFVGYIDDWSPAATARVYQEEKNAWHIGRVAVVKKQRRRGFALKILYQIEKIASENKISELHLDSQIQALPLYEKAGFKPKGTVFLDAGIQHRKMFKKIN
ncbi:GNAT family N-acetyltransferase [Oenococcus alcoholitolerans]|uniref:GNAT family N-acetyltransferase n=1 Tax=Oenococcus alcoholitolerans TaxID=931074 RepID=UPI003F70E192